MRLHPSLYPLVGIFYLIRDPPLLARTLGLAVMEILIPLYWFSDWLVDGHHRQIFEAVLSRELGPKQQLSQLTAKQRERVQQLVAKNGAHLHDNDADIAAKIEQKTRDVRVPGWVKALLWLITPPGPHAPILERILRPVVNLPLRVLFPAGPKLLGAGNARSLAAHAILPYLKKKGIKSPEEQAAIAYEHRWEFRAFGITAYVLGFIPILSWILNFSTSAGAALWAAEMERSGQLRLL